MEIVINFSFSRALAEKTLFVKALPKSQSSMKFFFLLVLAANLQHLCYDSDFVQILNKSLLYLWFKRFISFFFFSTQNFLLLVLKQHITNSSLKFCCRLVYCDKFNNFQKFFIYKDLSPCTSINLFNLARELNNLSLVLILITPS